MLLSLFDRRPIVVALAGPNGAGKTTFYYSNLQAAGLRLVNADCTVICEAPRIGNAREIMMERLSAVAEGPVHVKATRPEGLGSLGRVEGIACFAVALLEEIG